LHPDDSLIVGIISDTPFPASGRPLVSIDDPGAVGDLMLEYAEPIAQVLARAPKSPQQRRA
jgi:hypothetical protein